MREATARIARIATIEAASRIYETAPVGGPPQGEYLNAALRVTWSGDAESLLDALLAIERDLGRERRVRWAARTIDLDILWIEGVAIDSDRVTVPHPRLFERAFAVTPLLEVAPGSVDPRTGKPIAPVEDAAIRVVDGTLL